MKSTASQNSKASNASKTTTVSSVAAKKPTQSPAKRPGNNPISNESLFFPIGGKSSDPTENFFNLLGLCNQQLDFKDETKDASAKV